MSTNVTLRPSTPADADLIGEARLAELDRIPSRSGLDHATREIIREKESRRALSGDESGRGALRVVVVDGHDAGACLVERLDEGVLIAWVALLKTFRDRGVEARAVESIQAEARATDADLWLETPRDDALRRAYEGLGFAVDRTTATHYRMLDVSAADERWMREALAEARKGAAANETPIGAVVVKEGRIVGRGHNAPVAGCDPTAHAEIAAIREAASMLGGQWLDAATLYVTIEPCAMCAGAILQARLSRVVFGAPNEKFGVCVSQCDLLSIESWPHRVAWRGGVLSDRSAELMREFFSRKRGDQSGSIAAL